jgi:hypothetical protein
MSYKASPAVQNQRDTPKSTSSGTSQVLTATLGTRLEGARLLALQATSVETRYAVLERGTQTRDRIARTLETV